MKAAIKRGQSHACMSYAERKQARPKVKAIAKKAKKQPAQPAKKQVRKPAPKPSSGKKV